MASPILKPIPISPTHYYILPLPSLFLSIPQSRYRHRTRFNSFSHRNLLRAELNSVNSNIHSRTANSGIPEENNYSKSSINNSNVGEEVEYVEVFGIGSRKDAVLDFCLNSPFLSPALRFWNILVKDTSKVQLQQRFSNQDMVIPRVVEAPSDWRPCSKALIIVASAAYGNDDIAALDILRAIKSEKGLVAGIILRPFSFEGRRRQDEVNHLVGKLQEHADFYIDVDTNALLENDLVTLDEAVKTSNNAVLMAINAISILISEKHTKLQDTVHNGGEELKLPELQKILKVYREAKIGFGAGFNIKTSVLQAVHDCPFLGTSVKDTNGTIICILASSGIIDYHDAASILQVVRQSTGCKGAIVVSIIREPKLDLNLIRTTIIAFGCIEQQFTKKIGIFSRLAEHFPFIFNLLNKQSPKPHNTKESYVSPESQRLSGETSSEEHNQILGKAYLDDTSEDMGVYTQEVEPMFNDSDEHISSFSSSEGGDVEFSDSDAYPFAHMQNTKGGGVFNDLGAPTFKEDLLARYRLGPDNQSFQEWTKEGAADVDATLAPDNVSIYRLPVGVKRLEQSDDHPTFTKHQRKWIMEDSRKVQSDATPNLSWDAMGDRGLEATVTFNNMSKSRKANDSTKQGVLSNRAASMLEAERDSPNKKWIPILEIQYRGGIYRGRIQGGLPEGKGRLSLGDGSIYDGIWRFGKRSGLGTLYFKNGDVFKGSWRDDVMHGKGWFYFHTGDRWFVNFWKGKANGEGRFYSKLGDVFFGHFKDGWRHGHFLCIGVDGKRCHEVWEEGVLVSREPMDSNADDVA